MIISFRHDKQRSLRRRQFLGTFFVVALLMFVVRVPLANTLGGFLANVGGPIWRIEDIVREQFQHVTTAFTSKIALQNENTRLREQIDSIAIESYSREQLRVENEELKTKFGRSPEHTLLLARVLSSPASSPYDTFIVDVGTNHKVFIGMQVFGEGDFIIGEVTRVWRESALVTLYSSTDSEVSVTIGTRAIPGVAHGTGGGNFRITLPKGLDISVGELIEMPALSPSYAGVVGGVTRSSQSSLQVVFTRLPFNIYQKKWVYIALPAVVSEKAISPDITLLRQR